MSRCGCLPKNPSMLSARKSFMHATPKRMPHWQRGIFSLMCRNILPSPRLFENLHRPSHYSSLDVASCLPLNFPSLALNIGIGELQAFRARRKPRTLSRLSGLRLTRAWLLFPFGSLQMPLRIRWAPWESSASQHHSHTFDLILKIPNSL